ncbi:MAG: threonine synthase [Candidatus Omnitrophota bacterium]|jgi:threonine synthase
MKFKMAKKDNQFKLPAWPGIIQHYAKYLPVTAKTPIVTLQEGMTPLLHSEKLSKLCGLQVYLKYEGANPTGSFKDRGMTLAVTKAKEKGAKAVLCASTGNTSAAAAAYAARAKMACYVLLPEGAVAMGKLTQALMCNADVISIKGNFDDALSLAREITAKKPIELVNSVNPYRIEGQKTGAFEICDQLQAVPDYHLIPVGNAGNITAYWRGYQDYMKAGIIKTLPKMMGFQAAGSAPIVIGKPVLKPKTFATAIKIGNPASWLTAERAKYESNGLIDSVTDAEILKAYHWIAREEGMFVEPASAASIAGLFKMFTKGHFKHGKKKTNQIAVCVVTGHGLKDPSSAMKGIRLRASVKATYASVLKAIK